jgi:hypothetical protein
MNDYGAERWVHELGLMAQRAQATLDDAEKQAWGDIDREYRHTAQERDAVDIATPGKTDVKTIITDNDEAVDVSLL